NRQVKARLPTIGCQRAGPHLTDRACRPILGLDTAIIRENLEPLRRSSQAASSRNPAALRQGEMRRDWSMTEEPYAMPAHVNLDALIKREDFEIVGEGDAPTKPSIEIRELERDGFFFAGLRKPDFQRETSEWDPKRVAGLIRTFLEEDLIPAVILWKNRDLY